MKRGISALSGRSKHVLGVLLICAIILVVPVWSLVELGGFFRSDDSRKAAALPAFQERAVDANQPDPQLFKEPLLSVTFDDGWESVYTDAMPILQRDGIRTTQYVLSGVENDPHYMSWPQVVEMQKAGHEIACHTVTHPDLTTLSDSQIMAQLNGCKQTMSAHVGNVTDFASPYGAENGHTVNLISKVFGSQRNTNGDLTDGITDDDMNVAANFSRYDIVGFSVEQNTTVAELQKLLDYARTRNAWVVLTYHQADDSQNSTYALDTPELIKQLDFLSKSNFRIVTVSQALASLPKGSN